MKPRGGQYPRVGQTELARVGRAAGQDPGDEGRDALLRFADLVSEWGGRTDLAAARDALALAEVLFLDALVLADRAVIPEGASLVDVGAGVGAPSLPLLLLRPALRATLVEPRRKRVAFLRTAVGTLGLERRASVVEGTVEPDAPWVEGAPFDLALSRATFAPERWVHVGAGLASRVVVLTAAHEPPPPPEGWHLGARRTYHTPSAGAPRGATVYARE